MRKDPALLRFPVNSGSRGILSSLSSCPTKLVVLERLDSPITDPDMMTSIFVLTTRWYLKCHT